MCLIPISLERSEDGIATVEGLDTLFSSPPGHPMIPEGASHMYDITPT